MSTRVKGTGLGLFIVRSVVARHGGKVFVESDGAGQGSTFIVQLPVVELQRGAAMSRILVVEDEQHLADGLRFNLEAEQYDVEFGRQRRGGAAAADRRAEPLRPGDPRRDAAGHRRLHRRDAAARGAAVRAGADADGARPLGRRAARLRRRRRRLSAEAVRAADPAVARARAAAAPRVVPRSRRRRAGSRRRSPRSSRSATRASTSSSSRSASATSGCR